MYIIYIYIYIYIYAYMYMRVLCTYSSEVVAAHELPALPARHGGAPEPRPRPGLMYGFCHHAQSPY